jgi:uncharacterized delta-60 repeat protein
MKKIIFSLILTTLFIFHAQAQGGNVDYTFIPPSGTDGHVNSIVVQPDGKILLAGNFQKYGNTTVNHIVRISPEGATLDASFNTGLGTGSGINTIALQPDGKILIGGLFATYNGVLRNKIARLNPNGNLDESFEASIANSILVQTIAVQTDGKILIGGLFSEIEGVPVNNIARLNADGSLDPSFDMGTGASDYIADIVLQADGKILIGGYFTEYNGTPVPNLIRLNTDGTLDASFNSGIGANELVSKIKVLENNKILIAGEFTEYNSTAISRVARLEADGSLDLSFNPGTGADAYITSIAVQADDKIIVAGQFSHFNGVAKNRLARLHPDGSQDLTFNIGSGANNAIFTCTLQADSLILIGGAFTNYYDQNRKHVARVYNACGISYGVKNASICEGESYVFNNHTYTAAGAYVDTLQTALGCDSVVILVLNVQPAGTFNNPQTICESGSYTIGMNTYTETGVYRDTLQNIAGCDSIVVTQLTKIPANLYSTQTICEGNSYNFMTGIYSQTGTYTHVTEIASCSVSAILNLTVTPAPVSNISKTICDGQAYTYNGHVYTTPGVYRDTINKGLGCDSIVITTLNVVQLDASVTQAGGTLSANTEGASYQWLDAEHGFSILPNATSQSYTPLSSGRYAVEITYNDCVDTSSIYEIVLTGINASAFQSSIQFAPNPVEDYLEINVHATASVSVVNIRSASGQIVQTTNRTRVDVSSLAPGLYILEVETDKGVWRDRFVK